MLVGAAAGTESDQLAVGTGDDASRAEPGKRAESRSVADTDGLQLLSG